MEWLTRAARFGQGSTAAMEGFRAEPRGLGPRDAKWGLCIVFGAECGRFS